MSRATEFQYLESVRQPFVKGRNIWAEVLYRETIGTAPRSAEEVASDFEVPVAEVLEAIEYCRENASELRAAQEDSERRC